jgi:hypothetical protein
MLEILVSPNGASGAARTGVAVRQERPLGERNGMGSTTKNALEAHYGGVIRGNFARVSP